MMDYAAGYPHHDGEMVRGHMILAEQGLLLGYTKNGADTLKLN